MTSVLPRSTARITLRRLVLKDLADFQAYRSCEELARYQGWVPQTDIEATEFLNEMHTLELFQPDVWSQIGIAEAGSGRLIGDIGICVGADKLAAQIGFTLAQPYQGKGLASEAVAEAIAMLFDATPIQRVIGITDSRNSASIKLLQQIGMKLSSTDKAIFREQECSEHTYIIDRRN